MRTSPTGSVDRITVSVDRDLEDIVPIFLANRGKDVHTLRAALTSQDFETIRILGHRMKGDGGGYGFLAISEIGDTMELAAGRHDRPAIERLVAQLEDFLARVTVVYR
jgi:HPt (histidine-containing phosphotransfer) domain-containing protein